MPDGSAPVTSDALLMARVAAGEVDAFEVIYDRYYVPAYSLARRITGRVDVAEEATQDAFVTIWRSASVYDRHRGSLRSWLLTLVRHRSIDLVRQSSTRAARWEGEEALERLPAPVRTEEQVLADLEARDARGLVCALPREQRRVIELAYFGGFTQEEIATGTGIPLGTVKSRARTGLTRMRKAAAARSLVATAP
jgi:RNA polymerase sigma-70 factor (ECF subfamily)